MAQRSVIQFTKTNPLQAMTALEQAISLPHEYSPMRYPSFPALERTAVMSFNVPKTLSFPTGATSCKGAIFRQAAWPFWCDQTISNFGTMAVCPALDENGAGSGALAGQSYILLLDDPNYYTTAAVTAGVYPGVSGISTPSWEYPLFGKHQDRMYIYVPAGCYFTFVASSASKSVSTDVTYSVSYEVWTSKSSSSRLETGISVATTTNLGTMFTPSLSASNCWVRPLDIVVKASANIALGEISLAVLVSGGLPTYSPSAATGGLLNLPVNTVSAFFPFASPPEFDVTERPWKDTRTTAASLLLTNVTKVLNKEGTVLAGRLQNRSDGAWNFTSDTLSQLHPAEKAMLALETGFYTYCPPSTDLSYFYDYSHTFAFSGPVVISSTMATVPVFALDNDSYANCFVLTDSDPATPSSFAANVDWHIEFRNNSTLFPIGMSSITLEAFHQAILNLVSHGFFFCNFKHRAALKAILNAGRKYAPLALGMLPPPARMVATAGLKVADKVLTKKPNTTPPTTSAKASGMIPAHSKTKPKTKQQTKHR